MVMGVGNFHSLSALYHGCHGHRFWYFEHTFSSGATCLRPRYEHNITIFPTSGSPNRNQLYQPSIHTSLPQVTPNMYRELRRQCSRPS